MPSLPFSPKVRDLLLAVAVLCLLAAPLWVPVLELDDRTHQYERVELSTANGTIELEASDSFTRRHQEPVSDRIACFGEWNPRPCGLEWLLLQEGGAPSFIYTSNPDSSLPLLGDPYDFVRLNGSVYETSWAPNESAQRSDGYYSLELRLEQVPPEAALRDVAAPADASNLPGVVKRAARTGEATTHDAVTAPPTPVRTDDGSYYRVYETGSSAPPTSQKALDNVLTFGGPLFGLLGLLSVSRRFELVHVASEE